jgi:ATPase subunit of ABC transporter with duplicated ATPase domains
VKGLQAYDGTLVFVSHDRWFVGELATRIIEITPEGINDFPGSYREYLEKCGDDHLDAQAVLQKAREKKRDGKPEKKKRTNAEQAEARRERKQWSEKLEGITRELQQAESRLDEINQRFVDPKFYEKTPNDERTALEGEHRSLSEKVTTLMQQWEVAETKLGELPEA